MKSFPPSSEQERTRIIFIQNHYFNPKAIFTKIKKKNQNQNNVRDPESPTTKPQKELLTRAFTNRKNTENKYKKKESWKKKTKRKISKCNDWVHPIVRLVKLSGKWGFYDKPASQLSGGLGPLVLLILPPNLLPYILTCFQRIRNQRFPIQIFPSMKIK